MDAAAYIAALTERSGAAELAFPRAEYDERIARVRRRMASAGLDVLLVTHPCDLCYLAGYNTFGTGNHACLVLPADGAPSLQVTSMEIPAAVVNGWVEEVVAADWTTQADTGAELAGILEAKGLGVGRIGVALGRVGLVPRIYERLRATLARARFEDASDIVARERLVKSPRELAYLRKSAAITRAGIEASLGAIRAGITDNDVARVGYDAMIAAGSEFMAVQPIVTTGRRTAFVHQSYRRVAIEPGDVVFLEYGGCYQRYTAPLMRTAVVGQPSAAVQELAEAVDATAAAILATARPGRTHHEVALAARQAHAGMSDRIFFSGAYGYHVGIGFPPTWADGLVFMAEGMEEPLAAGMTLHLPLSFRIPGRFGVGLSETIVITDDGCERLVDHPRALHVIE